MGLMLVVVPAVVIGWIGAMLGRALSRGIAVGSVAICWCSSILMAVLAGHAHEYVALFWTLVSTFFGLLGFGLLIGLLSRKSRRDQPQRESRVQPQRETAETSQEAERIIAGIKRLRDL